ncbi:MAG: molecular chaperone TorD family protein [Pseudodesulfovibrio sp.]
MPVNDDMQQHPTTEALRVLADCYHQPDEKLAGRIEDLETLVESLGETPATMARNLLSELNEKDMGLLLVDYAKLFVGPFELTAPPFGSVYLEDGHKLMGESTMDVKQIYRLGGLEMSDDFSNPPDHIAAELEFLYFLHVREAGLRETDTETADLVQELRKEFLSRHLGAWGIQFAEKVRDNATTEFFQTLGGLTKVVIENEMRTISE